MNSLYGTTCLLALILCAFTGAHAQIRNAPLPADTSVLKEPMPIVPTETPPKTETLSPEKVFGGVEQPPEFPGGNKAMYKFIETNLRMPPKARKAGISGRVFTSFTVELTGEITNVTVLKGLGFGCDEEAIRLIKLMPRWKPGKQLNKFMKVKYNLPILFPSKQP